MARTEEPRHTAELREGDFELRRYEPRVVAETRVEGPWDAAVNEGFRRLAGYIFGGNHARSKIAMTAPVGQRAAGEKIAMTAPVGQRGDGGAWIVTFTMPAGRPLASFPEPDDPRVTLREVPGEQVVAVRFSGRWTDANMREHTEALRSWARGKGLVIAAEPEVNRYDPPWTPWFMRRNEVWFVVRGSQPAPN